MTIHGLLQSLNYMVHGTRLVLFKKPGKPMPPSIMQDVWHLAISFIQGVGGLASSAATTALTAVNPTAGVAWAAVSNYSRNGGTRRGQLALRPRGATPPPIDRTQEEEEEEEEEETQRFGYAQRTRGKSSGPARNKGNASKRASQSSRPAAPAAAAPARAVDPANVPLPSSRRQQRVKAFVQQGSAPTAASSSTAPGQGKKMSLRTRAMSQL